jgi:hypothetical protein
MQKSVSQQQYESSTRMTNSNLIYEEGMSVILEKYLESVQGQFLIHSKLSPDNIIPIW